MGKTPLKGGCSTTGSPAGIGGVLLAALALGARRRKAAAVAVGALALPGIAAAQDPRLDANFFENNPQTATFTIVRDAAQAPRGTISGELTTDYGLDPLEFNHADDVDRRGDVLDHAVGLHLGFNAAVTSWLELGFNMPLLQSVFYSNQTAENNAVSLGGSGDNLGLGDLQFQIGVAPLNWIDGMPFNLALVPKIVVPTGNQDVFASSGSVKAGGDLAIGADFDFFRFSLTGGGMWQDESRQVGDIYEDDTANWGAAIGIPFMDRQVEIRAEHAGKIVVADEARDRIPDYDWNRHAPMELLFGAAYIPKDFPVYVEAGVGPGLTSGYGAADVRAFVTVGARTLPKPRLAAITDADGDGIADEFDVCPYKAEDLDGFQDSDGCPDLDNDNDGIADVDDACINRPEVFNDYEDADGCPDQVASQVEVRDQEIVLYDKVYFEYDRATLRPVSKRVLDEVVATLKAHPDITQIELGGHADERGNQLYNLELSRQRAQAVRNYLISQGIEADRLTIGAYGEEKPAVADADDETEYAQNRRVQLTVQMTDEGLDLDDVRTVDADVPAIPEGFDPPNTDNDIPGVEVEIPG